MASSLINVLPSPHREKVSTILQDTTFIADNEEKVARAIALVSLAQVLSQTPRSKTFGDDLKLTMTLTSKTLDVKHQSLPPWLSKQISDAQPEKKQTQADTGGAGADSTVSTAASSG